MPRRSVVALALFTLVACKKPAAPPPPPLAWQPSGCGSVEVDVRGWTDACAKVADLDANVVVSMEGTDLLIGVHGFPNGTAVRSSDVTATSKDGNALLRIPVGDALAKKTVAEVFGADPANPPAVDLDRSFTIEFTDGRTLVTKAPQVKVATHLMTALAQAAGKPLRFGNEPTAVLAAHSALIASEGGRPRWFGSPKALSDIDWVAVSANTTEHELKTCDYQSRTHNRTVPLVGVDAKVTIYDRRTGAVIDSKDFVAATGECKASVGSVEEKVYAGVDPDAIAAWVQQRVTGAPVADAPAPPPAAALAPVADAPPVAAPAKHDRPATPAPRAAAAKPTEEGGM